MLQKAVNASKNNILLRSFFAKRVVPLLLVVCLLCAGVLTGTASAVVLDPYDLATSISVDGNADRLYIDLSGYDAYWHIHNESTSYEKEVYGSGITFGTPMRYFDNLEAECYPTGFDTISIEGVTTDSTFAFNYDVVIGSDDTTQAFSAKVTLYSLFYDASGENVASVKVAESSTLSIAASTFRTFALSASLPYDDFVLDSSAVSFGLYMFVTFTGVEDESDNVSCTLVLSGSTSISMSISSLYHQVQETGKGNELLESVEQKLEQNGQKLDDVIGELEELPGEIGDEMQGVIDAEKDEATSSGNKFVDQILDALPDPSVEVLSALKALTDATAYTGTEAVLPVPGIVLPGIDGLIPETEVWGGVELDFGEYMSILPPTLLTLVQSLFTIAIVLYCVYELKGIISYCLTLRESKGG